MSAIAGLLRFDGSLDPALACQRMLTAQAIYGPHASAQWDDGNVALGRRLFRTLPEDLYDRQPLVSSSGHCVIIADLRLDNREELVRELRIPKDQARGFCDAAVLLSAWERGGED